MKRINALLFAAALASATASAVSADVIIPGNLAGAPAWSPTTNVTVNLSQAIEGPWDSTPPSANPLIGTYDPTVWAVVFKFSSVNIPSNVTVNFINHPSNPPVVWLVDGPVTINGVVSLNGASGHNWDQVGSFATPGPGGFRGGRASDPGWVSAGGFGPGAGRTAGAGSCFIGSGGGYGQSGAAGLGNSNVGLTYGNPGVYPLIGGSGGSGGSVQLSPDHAAGGGSGAGAMLIAARTSIMIGSGTGRLRAVGGSGGNAIGSPTACGTGTGASGGGGSGGAFRLIAESILGSGGIDISGGTAPANAGSGGIGRVRIEANSSTIPTGPGYAFGAPGATARLFPDAATPIITDILVDGQMVPSDPEARISFPGADVAIPSGGAVQVEVGAVLVPTNSTMQVILLPSSGSGQRTITNIPFVSGDEGSSVWRGSVSIPSGISALQVRAVLP